MVHGHTFDVSVAEDLGHPFVKSVPCSQDLGQSGLDRVRTGQSRSHDVSLTRPATVQQMFAFKSYKVLTMINACNPTFIGDAERQQEYIIIAENQTNVEKMQTQDKMSSKKRAQEDENDDDEQDKGVAATAAAAVDVDDDDVEDEPIAATTTTTEFPWAWFKAMNQILSQHSTRPFVLLPVKLLPWLYLSDQANSVRRIDLLQQMNITHVLTTNYMTNDDLERIKYNLNEAGIIHHAVSGHDEPGYDMMGKHWDECRTFLENVRNQDKGKVVIHCQAGMNRSGLFAAAAMLVLDVDNDDNERYLLDVVTDLKAKRGSILTNESFQYQLCTFAAKEGRLGNQPDGYNNDAIPNHFDNDVEEMQQQLDSILNL